MSTSDELNLEQDSSKSGFVSAARKIKINWSQFSPGQVDISFLLLPDSWKYILER